MEVVHENTAIQIIKGGARLDHEKEVEEKDETLKEVKELKKIVLSLKENLNVFSENTEDKFKNLTIEVNDCYSDLKKEIKEYYRYNFFSEEENFIEIEFEVVEQMLEEDFLNERIKETLRNSLKIAKEKGLDYLAFELF